MREEDREENKGGEREINRKKAASEVISEPF